MSYDAYSHTSTIPTEVLYGGGISIVDNGVYNGVTNLDLVPSSSSSRNSSSDHLLPLLRVCVCVVPTVRSISFPAKYTSKPISYQMK